MSQPADAPSPSPSIIAVTALPGARKALILLVLINLMNYVDRQILSAVEEAIGKEYSVSATATGWLATAFLLAYMVFSPVFGVMADRVSRWAIVGVGVILWSLASGGSGAVYAFSHLLIMRLLIGIGEAAYGPVAPTLIADLYPVHIRGKVLAWFFAAIPVGSALGYVIGGMFEKWGHWHWAFYATVPPGILLGIWCFFMPEPPRGHAQKTKAKLADYLAILRIPSYTLDTLGMTAMTFAIGGVAFFMPRYLSGRPDIGFEPGTAKMVFGGIIVVAGLVATIAGGMAGDALRKRWSGSYFIVSAAGMLVGTPLFLLMLVTPFPACWVVIFLACFCLFFNTGPSNTILANVTRPTVRATAFALNIFVIHAFGDAISPPIIGWVSENFGGIGVGFALVSFMMFVGGLLWLAGAKYLERDTANVEAAESPPRGFEVMPTKPG